MEILGRNNNNNLTFNYSWDGGDSSVASHLNKITVVAESGLTATLNFADFSGHRLLSELLWPDGTAVSYFYDSNGNLLEVDEPENSSGSQSCLSHSPCLPQQYTYTGAHLLNTVSTPRYVMNPSNDGEYVQFSYYSWNGFEEADYIGVVDPDISDGYSTSPIQTGYSQQAYKYKVARLVYVGVGTGGTPVTWQWQDSDLHQTTYSFAPASGSVTQREDWTGTINLTSTLTWDSQNNLVSSTDARGNETDMAYDATGNLVAVAQPAVGSFRPTTLYSYDLMNNVTASCDPVFTHSLGKDWTTRPAASDTLCPTTTGATLQAWDYPSYAPFGELASVQDPTGYVVTLAYNSASQGGADYGLPTSVSGASFIQYNQSIVQPSSVMTYDSNGNVATFNSGRGTDSYSYDKLDRAVAITDADGVSSSRSFYPNGVLNSTQSAAQKMLGIADSFTYNPDDETTSETRYYGCSSASCAATTNKWYDAAGRIIEVELPHDSTDYNSFPWLIRYVYDLSMGGRVSFTGANSFQAYGDLYKSQEYLGSSAWQDNRGIGYDALGRPTMKFQKAPGSTTTGAFVAQYDSSASSLGFLSSTKDPLGEQAIFSYDALGRQTAVQFSGDGGVTPARQYAFDADGRILTVTSSKFGVQSYTYDADGRVIQSVEPSTGLDSPATLLYSYYPNGWRSALGVQSARVSANPLRQYSYGSDGLRTSLKNSYGGTSQTLSWAYTSAGRLSSQSDPYGSTTWGHDAYGRIASLVFPKLGNYQSFSYDGEGLLTGYSSNAGVPYNTVQTTFTDNNRGELVQENVADSLASGPTLKQSSANGYMVPRIAQVTIPPNNLIVGFDALNSVGLGVESTPVGGSCNLATSTVWTYDAAGRQSSLANTTVDYSTCNNAKTTELQTYDAENHLIGDCPELASGACNPNLPGTIGWGPNGHPVMTGSGTQTNTYHWDGDTLLFVSGVSPVDIKVETYADLVPSSSPDITMIDRDISGLAVMSRNNTGYSGWTLGNAAGLKTPGVITVAGSGSFVAIPVSNPYTRTDGVVFGTKTIQGVRASDPGNNVWLSPDPYAGSVESPSSLKPYIWNGNNPNVYSDPSGFVTDPPLQASGGSAESPGQEVFDHEEALYGLLGIGSIWRDFEAKIQSVNKAGSYRVFDEVTQKLSIFDSGAPDKEDVAEAKYIAAKLYLTRQLLRYFKLVQLLDKNLTIHTTARALSEPLKDKMREYGVKAVQWRYNQVTGRFVRTGVRLLDILPVFVNLQQIENSILNPRGTNNEVRVRLRTHTKDSVVTTYCGKIKICVDALF